MDTAWSSARVAGGCAEWDFSRVRPATPDPEALTVSPARRKSAIGAPSVALAAHSSRCGNLLFAALPERQRDALYPRLEHVHLDVGEVLGAPDGRVAYAHFPVSAIVSLSKILHCGATVELAGVGREGVVGLSHVVGRETASCRSEVQIAGAAFRIPAELLKRQIDASPEMQRWCLRYYGALFREIAQVAACYRHHAVEQQLCRWLLTCSDRAHSNRLRTTHERIATLLGVRRQGVTEAARELDEAGIIRNTRGEIAIVDADALNARACECYRAIKGEYASAASGLGAHWDHISQHFA
jgi:CRP-like cAMP-binding protein